MAASHQTHAATRIVDPAFKCACAADVDTLPAHIDEQVVNVTAGIGFARH
jgi:hypothetical protein